MEWQNNWPSSIQGHTGTIITSIIDEKSRHGDIKQKDIPFRSLIICWNCCTSSSLTFDILGTSGEPYLLEGLVDITKKVSLNI